MAAALARGTTRIENAAKEPEIADLCDFLTQMGAHISGGGTSTILIEGRETLHGCRYRPIPDRIEAGTLLCAAAMTEGSVLLRGVRPEHMRAVLYKLGESGVTLRESAAGLRLSGRATQPAAGAHAGVSRLPTDMQAPMMALALSLRGTSVFLEPSLRTASCTRGRWYAWARASALRIESRSSAEGIRWVERA